jgi:hypothetical protein
MKAYVRALSSGEWFGAWAPVAAEILWENNQQALLRLVEEDLEAGDEYEFYIQGSLLLCLWDDGVWKAVHGVSPDAGLEDVHPAMIVLPE